AQRQEARPGGAGQLLQAAPGQAEAAARDRGGDRAAEELPGQGAAAQAARGPGVGVIVPLRPPVRQGLPPLAIDVRPFGAEDLARSPNGAAVNSQGWNPLADPGGIGTPTP